MVCGSVFIPNQVILNCKDYGELIRGYSTVCVAIFIVRKFLSPFIRLLLLNRLVTQT